MEKPFLSLTFGSSGKRWLPRYLHHYRLPDKIDVPAHLFIWDGRNIRLPRVDQNIRLVHHAPPLCLSATTFCLSSVIFNVQRSVRVAIRARPHGWPRSSVSPSSSTSPHSLIATFIATLVLAWPLPGPWTRTSGSYAQFPVNVGPCPMRMLQWAADWRRIFQVSTSHSPGTVVPRLYQKNSCNAANSIVFRHPTFDLTLPDDANPSRPQLRTVSLHTRGTDSKSPASHSIVPSARQSELRTL